MYCLDTLGPAKSECSRGLIIHDEIQSYKCDQVLNMKKIYKKSYGSQILEADLQIKLVLLPVFGGEGGRAGEHVVHESAERPPVDGFSVAAPRQDFRRHVFDCAAETEIHFATINPNAINETMEC